MILAQRSLACEMSPGTLAQTDPVSARSLDRGDFVITSGAPVMTQTQPPRLIAAPFSSKATHRKRVHAVDSTSEFQVGSSKCRHFRIGMGVNTEMFAEV